MEKMMGQDWMDNVIAKYGFEAKETIRFCHKVEWLNKEWKMGNEMMTGWALLGERYNKLMKN